jgi:ribose 5-phosphate isomerase A
MIPESPGGSTAQADPLAEAAVSPIRSGMLVALGTGRTAARAIRALAVRVRKEGLDVTCVTTSAASEALARSLGLRVVTFNEAPRPDYLFDGADEIDPHLHMIKGGGGAMTRERIVAAATLVNTGALVYIAEESKLVERLGTSRPVPIEVLAFARVSVTRMLESLGWDVRQRLNADGSPAVTDNGSEILDMTLPPELSDAAGLDRVAGTLDCMPGIIDHGLFLDEAQTVILQSPDGTLRHLRRDIMHPPAGHPVEP